MTLAALSTLNSPVVWYRSGSGVGHAADNPVLGACHAHCVEAAHTSGSLLPSFLQCH